MSRELSPCGTLAAYRRHKRKDEPVDEACAAANRADKNGRKDQERSESGAAVGMALQSEEGVGEVDALFEAKDNLRIIRAALRSDPPHNTIAALTKRRDELVDRIRQIMAENPEVSAFDQLAAKRAARRVSEATG